MFYKKTHLWITWRLKPSQTCSKTELIARVHNRYKRVSWRTTESEEGVYFSKSTQLVNSWKSSMLIATSARWWPQASSVVQLFLTLATTTLSVGMLSLRVSRSLWLERAASPNSRCRCHWQGDSCHEMLNSKKISIIFIHSVRFGNCSLAMAYQIPHYCLKCTQIKIETNHFTRNNV